MDFDHFRAMDSMLQKTTFSLDFTCCEAMMWKAEQPTTKSCRNKVSMNTLPWNDACISGFNAWVHSKTIFTRFHSHSAGGEGGLRTQFFRSHSGSKISIHTTLCHDARIWPISCMACFYALVGFVVPMALCTLFQTFRLQFFFQKFYDFFSGAPTLPQNI